MAAGTPPTRTERADVDQLVDAVTSAGLERAAAVGAVAEAMARSLGGSIQGTGLRLADAVPSRLPGTLDVSADADSLGRLYERLLAPEQRTRRGTHLTPGALAQRLIGCLDVDWEHAQVLDPAVGAASFLLAAYDAKIAAGVGPMVAVESLHGRDTDELAVAVAEAALAIRLLESGTAAVPVVGLQPGDALRDELPNVDVVVGNPPFLGQLRRRSGRSRARRAELRGRWPELVGPYTDDAWLFVAAALEALGPGGSLLLIQPLSVLGARNAQAIRTHLLDLAELSGVWSTTEKVFDAQVNVCALMLRRKGAGPDAAASTARWWGSDVEPAPAAPVPVPSGRWGSVVADLHGVPHVSVQTADRGTVGDRASATAGFRDQFYGFAEHLVDDESVDDENLFRPLVTVGMIDPFDCHWGRRRFRFAGAPRGAPRVDIEALSAGSPALARWVEARTRPKILLATQSRVIEAAVDVGGAIVPATPVITVEPDDVEDLWMLAAALGSPALSAWARQDWFGTALSPNALKLAAADVLTLPLPSDARAWRRGAALVEQLTGAEAGPARQRLLESFASTMDQAYGTTVAPWWLDQI